MANWARTLHDSSAALDYEQDARRVAAAFAPAFWFDAGGYLHDVVDVIFQIRSTAGSGKFAG